MDKSIFTNRYKLLLGHLRTARAEANLTQADIAKSLRTTQSFVSKCERGERRLDVLELRAWCRALGISFPSFIARLERSIAAKGEDS